jgi:hypothetical protein
MIREENQKMKAKSLLAAILGLALALSALTGVAGAGKPDDPGKSEDAPGQVKKAEQAPAPVAPASKSSAKSTKASSKQEARASGPGVKPSNSTSKWTTCSTGGGQGTDATCSGTHSSKADSSKQYGHGGTAAQIANSRGAPAGTVLTGPGNSQPHKVAVCPKQANKSGGVDVHAVKSFDTSACEQKQPAKVEEQKKVELQACPPVTTQVVTTTDTVVMHHAGPTKVVPISPSENSAHFKNKHPDDVQTVTKTQTVVTAGVCKAEEQQQVLAAEQQKAAEQQQVLAAEQPQQPAAQQEQGGVLGAQAVVRQPPAQQAQGGVLGEIGAVAAAELPFTGLQLWILLLAGIGLLAAGLGARRAMR